MSKVWEFLKYPFNTISASWMPTIIFYTAVAAGLIFLIVFFGVSGTKRKIKKNKKILLETQSSINDQKAILVMLNNSVSDLKQLVGDLKTQVSAVAAANSKMVGDVKDIVDCGNKQMAAIIFESFPTKEEKSKAQLFDKLGGMFANATVNPDRLDKVITNYNLDKQPKEEF